MQYAEAATLGSTPVQDASKQLMRSVSEPQNVVQHAGAQGLCSLLGGISVGSSRRHHKNWTDWTTSFCYLSCIWSGVVGGTGLKTKHASSSAEQSDKRATQPRKTS